MTATSLTLLLFIAWMMVPLLMLGGLRVYLSVTRQHRVNRFSPTGEDVSPFSARLVRAHANCYEFFPIAGGLLLYALAMDLTHITNGLAYVLLAARVLQSVVHILSTSVLAVQLRFAFFITQVGICVYWLIQLLRLHWV